MVSRCDKMFNEILPRFLQLPNRRRDNLRRIVLNFMRHFGQRVARAAL
jgi:hypothetical protein